MVRPGYPNGDAVPDDFPDVVPAELFPTNNIRFVIAETAKLIERVDNLSKSFEKNEDRNERALEKATNDLKEQYRDATTQIQSCDAKLANIEKNVSFVKGAAWVFGSLFAIFLVILTVLLNKLL